MPPTTENVRSIFAVRVRFFRVIDPQNTRVVAGASMPVARPPLRNAHTKQCAVQRRIRAGKASPRARPAATQLRHEFALALIVLS